MRTWVLAVVGAWMVVSSVEVAVAAGAGKGGVVEESAARDVEAWHQGRLKRLQAEDGWLTLAGLHWLHAGVQEAGSAEGLAVQMDAGLPARVGTFTLEGGKVRFQAEAGAGVTGVDGRPVTAAELVVDADGPPTVLRVGTYSIHAIRRGEKTGLRVKNSAAKTRAGFRGIDRFPFSGRWVVKARWEAFEKPRKVGVPNVLGMVEEMDSPGVAVFMVDGKEQRLQPVVEPGDNQLFFIFGDATNKDVTYGAGRFLYADLPKGGAVTLDFNRAYNPPCAFTSYATCPIPPASNRLAVRVEAGEKRYGDH